MKRLLDLMVKTNPKLAEAVLRELSAKVPTQAFRQLTFSERLRLVGSNPEKYEPMIGQVLSRAAQKVTKHPRFNDFARYDEKAEKDLAGASTGIGIAEGQVISLLLEPFAKYFFPSSASTLIGHLTGFDVVSQFLPSPLTNLYLTRSSLKIAPRHAWGQFLWGKMYVIPKGRPTHAQRALDGLLTGLNAESPASLFKYILTMTMVLFAKEMWRRQGSNQDTGTPPPGQQTLGQDGGGSSGGGSSGGGSSGQSASGQTGSSGDGSTVGQGAFGGTSSGGSSSGGISGGVSGGVSGGIIGFRRPFMGPQWYGSGLRMLRMSGFVVLGRLVSVRCLCCGAQYLCSETHAVHTIFPAGDVGEPMFPCPACNERYSRVALLVFCQCEVRLIMVPRVFQYMVEGARFYRLS